MSLAQFSNLSKSTPTKLLKFNCARANLTSRPTWPFVLPLLAVILLGHAAPASATHPVVRPPTAAKGLGLAEPIPLASITDGRATGLDKLNGAERDLLMKQARLYLAYRGEKEASPKRRQWLEKCRKDLNANKQNQFCVYELERLSTTNPKSPVIRAERREAIRQIAGDLRDRRLENIVGRDMNDVTNALSIVGDADVAIEIGEKAKATSRCLAPELMTSLAYKIEDRFPQDNAVTIAKALYSRSVECGGNNPASATAAFRLGLILIWQKQCRDVPALMAKVEANPDVLQFQSRAKYWTYYCEVVNGNSKSQTQAKEQLMKLYPLSFQNLAANGADRDFTRAVLSEQTLFIAFQSVIRPDVNALLRATEAVAKAGAPSTADEMIDRNLSDIGSLEPEVRLYVAAFLHRHHFTLTAFKVLSGLFQDAPRMVAKSSMKMYFPMSYLDVVRKRQSNVDPLLILSLIRQESAFNPSARSTVGARGLMQVMPATARSIAALRHGDKLFEPETNVRIGTKYFMHRLTQYGGDVELTLAAYNAGANRVERWLKRYPTDNKLLFLDLIPFKETREYVAAILRNYYWYIQIYADAIVASSNQKYQKQQSGHRDMKLLNAQNRTENISQVNSGSNNVAHSFEQVDARTQAIMEANAGVVASVPTDWDAR